MDEYANSKPYASHSLMVLTHSVRSGKSRKIYHFVVILFINFHSCSYSIHDPSRSSAIHNFSQGVAHGSLETFGGPQRHAIAHLKAVKIVIPNMLSVMLGKSVLF